MFTTIEGLWRALLEVYEAALEDYDEAIRRGLDTPVFFFFYIFITVEAESCSNSGTLMNLNRHFTQPLSLARQTGETTLVTEIEQYLRDMNLDSGEDA